MMFKMNLITGENEIKSWKVGSIGFTREIYLRKERNVLPVTANTIYNINGLWSYVSIPVYAKTMLPPTDVNIHSRANQKAPADRPSHQSGPLTDEGHTVPIVWVNDGLS